MTRRLLSKFKHFSNTTNGYVGIWGLGIVGKSAIRYLSSFHQLSAIDRRILSRDEQDFLNKHKVSFIGEENLEEFFRHNDYVIVSPGINHPALQKYKDKIISELDLFNSGYKKSVIAVTGSVGKTSTVHLLGKLLGTTINIQTGGNIGIGMLDLIADQDKYDAALLELSSFQLERSSTFSPDLAIWTNFYPNHLDWHGSQEAYFQAKLNIIRNQNDDQQALMPLPLLEKLLPLYTSKRNWYFMSIQPPCPEQLRDVCNIGKGVFYVQANTIVLQQQDDIKPLITLNKLPPISFIENWITLSAALHLLQIPTSIITTSTSLLTLPEHRLEKVTTIDAIDFYNDSKSTTPAATAAAVHALRHKPIILLLGGIGKGINRSELIEHMDSSVKLIVVFGKEREELEHYCHRYNKQVLSCTTLDEALNYAVEKADSGNQIVLSPAGASFDHYENYKERGNHFKKIISRLKCKKRFQSGIMNKKGRDTCSKAIKN